MSPVAQRTPLRPLGWLGIVRLGLVQTALGAIVVLVTSTLNRVMVVELGLAAMVPGVLVALHYAVQVLRPRWGHGSDVGGRRTPWIIGGMAVLAAGGIGAALATTHLAAQPVTGALLAVLAYLAVGIGVGASGTSLLVLMAARVAPERRPAAATITWVMMIAGFIVTAGVAGHYLDPYTPERLLAVTASVALLAFALSVVAVLGIEGAAPRALPTGADSAAVASAASVARASAPERRVAFRAALAQVWSEPAARRFTLFVFVSMLAYSAQDLILEPYAGMVFGFTPGQSTQLSGVQHGGVLAGMVAVGLFGTRLMTMRAWTVAGCLWSAAALLALAVAGTVGPDWPLAANVFALGVGNGVFAVAAIGSMMSRVDDGRADRAGTRMGLWGAAQAIAFGIGGLAGTLAFDAARALLGAADLAYITVFAAEAVLFVASAALALRIDTRAHGAARTLPQVAPSNG